MLQKNAMADPAETLEKALERNLLNVEHDRPLPLLTSLLVKSSVSHPNPIKPAFQGVGSVPAGSAQCNDKQKSSLPYLRTSHHAYFFALVRRTHQKATPPTRQRPTMIAARTGQGGIRVFSTSEEASKPTSLILLPSFWTIAFART